MSEARFWSDTPLCAAEVGRTWLAAVFAPGGVGGYQLQGALTSGGLIRYQGK